MGEDGGGGGRGGERRGINAWVLIKGIPVQRLVNSYWEWVFFVCLFLFPTVPLYTFTIYMRLLGQILEK